MKKQIARLGIVASILTLSACVSYKPYGTVLPVGEGEYKIVNTGSTESNALKKSALDAKGTCKNDGKKKFIVVSQDSEYIGATIDKGDTKGAMGLGAGILQAAANHYNKENHKVQTVIRCS